jgi:hypothetical protein
LGICSINGKIPNLRHQIIKNNEYLSVLEVKDSDGEETRCNGRDMAIKVTLA